MMPYATKRLRAVRREGFSVTGQPLTLEVHAHGSFIWSIIVIVLASPAVLVNCHWKTKARVLTSGEG